MCDRCIDTLQKYFPGLPESEAVSLLWNETNFPFGKAEDVERQLRKLAMKEFVSQEIGE